MVQNKGPHDSSIELYCKNCKAIDRLVVMLIDYCMFKKLNHLCTIFDIDVNGGEVQHEKHCIMREKYCNKGSAWSKNWLMKRLVGILGIRCFSSMLSSMPKQEIVSMNVDAMGEYYRTLLWCIYNYVCHWRKHSNEFVKHRKSSGMWFLY